MSTTPVTVRRHAWHELSQRKVEVFGVDSSGMPVVVHDEDAQWGVSCLRCFAPLTPDNVDEECVGEDELFHHPSQQPEGA